MKNDWKYRFTSVKISCVFAKDRKRNKSYSIESILNNRNTESIEAVSLSVLDWWIGSM